MTDPLTSSGKGKPSSSDRRVKSVNFTDDDLYKFACRRSDNLYGGNFSAYVTELIDRDRSGNETRRSSHDLESRIFSLIEPYGGTHGPKDGLYDFEISNLDVVIEVQSRFPREKQLEYKLLNALQKISFNSPLTKIVVALPNSLPGPEKERFRQFETCGIENLRVCNLNELEVFLASLIQPDTETLENALLDQEETDLAACREGLPQKS